MILHLFDYEKANVILRDFNMIRDRLETIAPNRPKINFFFVGIS